VICPATVGGTMSNAAAGNVPPTAAGKLKACCSRLGVFVYDLVVVAALLVVAVYYVKSANHYWLAAPTGTGDKQEISYIELSLRAMWFGALGGTVISLKGVYDHCCDNDAWDRCFELWHVGRPVSGALTGLITLVLLLATNPKGTPSEPVVYAIAFIFGTQESRFFNFLFEVAALVVRVPNDTKDTTLKAGDIQPSSGKAGSVVLIGGNGFTQGATVTIGGNPLGDVVVSKDGKSIVGTVPAGSGAVDVMVTNADGKRAVLAGKFTYMP
jgi:hypothetical protein